MIGMMRRAGRVLLAAGLVCGAGAAEAADYALNGDNTAIKFVGAKKDGTHEGGFKKLTGTLSVPEAGKPSAVSVTIDVNSMWSDNDKLTAHLKAPDFFDAKRFPEAKFVSKSIKPTKDGYDVTGDLTMHGQTKSITFPAKITSTAAGTTLASSFTIKRSDWGISYGAGQIDEDVKISLDIKTK